MKLLILAATCLAVVSCDSLSDEVEKEFQEWKAEFGKAYSSPEEEARRKDIWLSNRERVLAHNAEADQGKHTWWMDMNSFSDMTPSEIPTGLRPRQRSREIENLQ